MPVWRLISWTYDTACLAIGSPLLTTAGEEGSYLRLLTFNTEEEVIKKKKTLRVWPSGPRPSPLPVEFVFEAFGYTLRVLKEVVKALLKVMEGYL